jgi:hypothetical protein
VVIFVLIEFSLIIIPFAFLELRPEATKAALKNAQDWLLSHARQLMAYTALILGPTGPSAAWCAWPDAWVTRGKLIARFILLGGCHRKLSEVRSR